MRNPDHPTTAPQRCAALLPILLLGVGMGCSMQDRHRSSPARESLLRELYHGTTPHPVGRQRTRITTEARHVSGSSHDLTEARLALAYGLTREIEVNVRAPYLFRDARGPGGTENGLGDVVIGALYNMGDSAGWVLSSAIDFDFGSADRSKGLGDGRGGRGDFFAVLRCGLPEPLTDRQKELIRELGEAGGADVQGGARA